MLRFQIDRRCNYRVFKENFSKKCKDLHSEKIEEGFDWYEPKGICGPGYYNDSKIKELGLDEYN